MITARHEELRAKLSGYLDRDSGLRAVVTYTKQRFDAETRLTAHNWEHIYRDTLNAIVIGEAEGAEMRVVLPAIVLHDIGYLYDGPTKEHGPRGADKLPEYLDAAGISYPADDVAKLASCIRTHKGTAFDAHPDGLEAKVVADADLLEKFGAFGVYQHIRSLGEFRWPLTRIIEFSNRFARAAVLETETGRQLAEPGRRLVIEFFRELTRAAEPYGDAAL